MYDGRPSEQQIREAHEQAFMDLVLDRAAQPCGTCGRGTSDAAGTHQ